jgi:ferredoxin
MDQVTKVTVAVDGDVCVGSAMCRALSPDVFKRSSSGKTTATDAPVDPEAVQDAVDNCPVAAITIDSLPA